MKKLCVLLLLITVSLLITGCGINTIFYDNADEYVKGAGVISEEITELEIEWIAGNVEVKFHDADNVVIEEDGVDVASCPLYHRFKDGKLSIKYGKSGTRLNTHFGKELTVRLPRTTLLDSLKISSASADLAITETASRNAEISSASGAVTLNNSSVDGKLNVSTASGRIMLNDTRVGGKLGASTASGDISVKLMGTCNTIELESTSGRINTTLEDTRDVSVSTVSGLVILRAYVLPNTIEAESVSGGVSVYLPEGEPFSFEADSVSGSVNCEFGAAKKGDVYTVDGGKTDYSFESVSGSIQIKKFKR